MALRKSPVSSIAITVLVFGYAEKALRVALIRKEQDLFGETWYLPDTWLDTTEDADHAASRLLKSELKITDVNLRQLKWFSQPRRDPRTRTISLTYWVLLSPEFRENWEEDIRFFPLDQLPAVGLDHVYMIRNGAEEVKNQLQHSHIPFELLPKSFTLGELQEFMEIITGKALDRRNFRKQIQLLPYIQHTGNYYRPAKGKPSALYAFDYVQYNACLISG